MLKIAVIDLGTNGFRLQIAEVAAAGDFRIIHREAIELQLASEGFERIGDAPFARGMAAMQQFATTLQLWNVTKTAAFGTAALRLAANGKEFIAAVQQATNIQIALITGEREADLIYKGMKMGLYGHAKTPATSPFLMVDVGGGSVEFIIGDSTAKYWARSFNVGVTILKQNFQPTDTLFLSEVAAIENFLEATCIGLRHAIAEFIPKTPVIACGTLDILAKITAPSRYRENMDLPKASFDAFYREIAFLSTNELVKNPAVPSDKVEMLAVSFVLLDWIMRLLQADKMTISVFSMKAGILHELSDSSVQ